MEIRYEFINGDIVIVEVDEELGNWILASRRREASDDKYHHRYCYSLDVVNDKSSWTASDENNPDDIIDRMIARIEAEADKEEKSLIKELEKYSGRHGRNDYKLQLLIELYGGLRMGEINALKPENIHLEKGYIHVEATVSRGIDGRSFIKSRTKTYAGMRDVPISETLRPILEKALEARRENPEDLLFYDYSKKGIIETSQVNCFFRRITAKAGIPITGQHSLRHTFATRCIEAGVPALVLKKWLGHTNIHITLDTYADVFARMDFDATEKFDELMSNLELGWEKTDYISWITDVKERYRSAQIRAAVKINSEQLVFNWQLGRDLVVRKAEEKWGSGVVEQVSLDLKSEFPDVKGFSVRNLWNMKKWYSFYSSYSNFAEAISEIEETIKFDSTKLQQVGAELSKEKMHQAGAEIPFPKIFAFVPWRHHVEIASKCKSLEEALFYVKNTVENGYSREALVNVMHADYYHTQGNAPSNYSERLPISQAQLAQEITKGNYDLGFISLPANYDEKALEKAIEQNITRFLLELGTGFAFIGRQKEIIVSGKPRKIDLLFYHIKLRCYVVVELKVTEFEPEFVGKLNFYVSAVDEVMKTEEDNPSIGLIICRDMDRTEVEWSFRNVSTPMGIATYSNIQIEAMEEILPTREQIVERVKQAEEELNLKRPEE